MVRSRRDPGGTSWFPDFPSLPPLGQHAARTPAPTEHPRACLAEPSVQPCLPGTFRGPGTSFFHGSAGSCHSPSWTLRHTPVVRRPEGPPTCRGGASCRPSPLPHLQLGWSLHHTARLCRSVPVRSTRAPLPVCTETLGRTVCGRPHPLASVWWFLGPRGTCRPVQQTRTTCVHVCGQTPAGRAGDSDSRGPVPPFVSEA